MMATKRSSSARNKRLVTSAIPGLSVAQVRKMLELIRKRWQSSSETESFFISEQLPNNMTIQEFAFKFVLGHHLKRFNKSTKK